MQSLNDAAQNLASEIQLEGHTGFIMHLNPTDGKQLGVFSTSLNAEWVAAMAMAIDRNPELINPLIQALKIVKQTGNSSADAGFNDVIFAGDRSIN
jgi:hypothetical protein